VIENVEEKSKKEIQEEVRAIFKILTA